MNENINTKDYWEQRFSSNDWEDKQGRWQTESFSKGQMEYLRIASDFEGVMLDFGCGLGDAMPVYRENFPQAKLVGVDISQTAIDKCREKYGGIASFMQGDHRSIPEADIIIASNVFEHLTDDRSIAKCLLSKCSVLYIIVPYRERPLCPEHVNTYDEHYFSGLGKYDYQIFPCIGWTPYGLRGLYYNVYFKNIFRLLFGRPVRHRNMQIMFSFSSTYN